MYKAELLAPAGNEDAFEAALAAGADAIYLGVDVFNARARADNFALSDLSRVCLDAHLHGCRVYLCANTLIFEDELDAARAMVWQAASYGIDAVIVQDVGLARILHHEMPQLELHASTQMNISDKQGIAFADRLGCSRVTLARELGCEQISKLADSKMDLEVFVHGALCICESGRCLFSSMVGRRSANRGMCAQLCRMPYELYDARHTRLKTPGAYLLSPRDLCAIEYLGKLICAGIRAFKIEGRMKSAEYVYTVTSIYRAALDRACKDPKNFCAYDFEKAALEEVFSRGFTAVYLEGRHDNSMMAYTRPNNRGIMLGRVERLENGRVVCRNKRRLERGDVLEFWTSGKNVVHVVDSKDELDKSQAILCVKGAVAPGDRIFRIRTARVRKAKSQAVKDKLKLAVSMKLEAHLGAPLALTVSMASSHHTQRLAQLPYRQKHVTVQGPVVEEARTKAIGASEVIEQLSRLGASSYCCDEWDIHLDEGVGISYSVLHRIRAAALEKLTQTCCNQVKNTSFPALGKAVSKVHSSTKNSVFISEHKHSDPIITTLDDPRIAHSFKEFKPKCQIGPELYVTNSAALDLWAQAGASFVWLSYELSLRQIEALVKISPLPLGISVAGAVELMVSRHCFLEAAGSCKHDCASCKRRTSAPYYYKDKLGYEFPVTTDKEGRGHLYNSLSLDIVYMIGRLRKLGICGFALDTSLMSNTQARKELQRIREACSGKKFKKDPKKTTGHLFSPLT